ncbi:MAG: hypothetical protein LBH43_15815 [Treponema sp.]|nr:hypothetical protein [Treponema sp.]
MNKPAVILAVFLIFFGAGSHAQARQPWWYTLEQGKHYFRSGSYGNALMAFEIARRTREERFTRMEEDFIMLLSMPEVRRLGDSLEQIEFFISDYHRTEAAAALAELFYRIPRQSLNGSALKALNEFDRLKAYPEAEYWLGETYRVEGELGLALKQYKKAYDARELLETPGFETEILYKMATLHRLKGEYQEMEKRLLEILAAKSAAVSGRQGIYWTREGEGAVVPMQRILENDGVSHFLTLYRNDNAQIEKAHRLLGIFYYTSNRHGSAAEQLMFAFLIQNTLLINEVRRMQYNFEFTTLENLMEALHRRNDLKDWMEETQYYRTAYYFAAALYASGKMISARQIWFFLAALNEAGEWQEKARNQLRSPFIERMVEMP